MPAKTHTMQILLQGIALFLLGLLIKSFSVNLPMPIFLSPKILVGVYLILLSVSLMYLFRAVDYLFKKDGYYSNNLILKGGVITLPSEADIRRIDERFSEYVHK